MSQQIATPQELRILQFYVNGLNCKKENRFDCLKKNGFIGFLAKCAATTTFDTFSADIDREAKKQKYRGKYIFFKLLEFQLILINELYFFSF